MSMNFFEQNFSNRINEIPRGAHLDPISPRQGFQPASLEDYLLISGMSQHGIAQADWNQQHQAAPIDALMTGIISCLGLKHPGGMQFTEKMGRSDIEALLYACQLCVSNAGVNRTKGLFRLHLLSEVSKLAGKPMRYQIIADHIAEAILSKMADNSMQYQTIVNHASGGVLLMSNGSVTLIVTQAAIYNLAHFRKDFLMKYFSKIEDIETLYENATASLEVPKRILQKTIQMITRPITSQSHIGIDDHCAVATAKILETDSIRVFTPDGVAFIESTIGGETHAVVEEGGEFIDITSQGRKLLGELNVVTLRELSLRASQLYSVLFSKNVRSDFMLGLKDKAEALVAAVSGATTVALQKEQLSNREPVKDTVPAQTQLGLPDYTPVITEALLHGLGSGDVSSSSSQVSFKGSQTNYTITGIQPGDYGYSIKIYTSETKEINYLIDVLTCKGRVSPLLSVKLCNKDTPEQHAGVPLATLKVLSIQIDRLLENKDKLLPGAFRDMCILQQRLNSLLK